MSVKRFLFWHWQGKLPLAISYWGISVLLESCLAFAAGNAFGALMAQWPSLRLLLSFIFTVSLLSLAVWSIVGTWRAACMYDAVSQKVWGTLAKFALLLGFIRLIVQLIH